MAKLRLTLHRQRATSEGRRWQCNSTVCVDELPYEPQRILVLTDDAQRPQLSSVRTAVAEVAATHTASVLLYDLASPGLLTDPYPHFAGPEWRRPLGREKLRVLGREYLVKQIEEFEEHGVEVAAVIPDHQGFDYLADCAAKERVDLIVAPDSSAHPSFLDRLKGCTLERLSEHTAIPVAVYESDGSAWLVNASALVF